MFFIVNCKGAKGRRFKTWNQALDHVACKWGSQKICYRNATVCQLNFSGCVMLHAWLNLLYLFMLHMKKKKNPNNLVMHGKKNSSSHFPKIWKEHPWNIAITVVSFSANLMDLTQYSLFIYTWHKSVMKQHLSYDIWPKLSRLLELDRLQNHRGFMLLYIWLEVVCFAK